MTEAFAAWIAAGGDDETQRAFDGRPWHRARPTRSQPVSLPDGALATRLQQGDERAFEELYHGHARAIAAYIAAIGHVRSDVQDILQEAYLTLWRRRATLEPSDHIVGFLYRTARNLALTTIRHARVVARAESEVYDSPPGIATSPIDADTLLDAQDRQHHLAAALAALPERQRLAIQLRFYEELPYAEIGRVLGVGENAAFMLVSRAIRALRPVASLFAPQHVP